MRLTRHRSAFSIIELLISLIIISILSAMVILIASQRAAEARLRAAQADMRMIAEAEQQAAIDSGYFLRLYVLDDLTGPGDGISPGAANDILDAIEDEDGNTRNIDGDVYAIVPELGSLFRQGSANPGDLLDRSNLFTVENETRLGIGLPYISYPREFTDEATGINYNVPSDPWGMPYLLFTRQGAIIDVDTVFSGTPAGSSPALVDPLTVQGAPSNPYDATIFDRMTIVSFGPDGLPGDGGFTDIGDENSDDLRLQIN
jgi:prepilin-type N-terminal cleavage/methylation domain-containing protein